MTVKALLFQVLLSKDYYMSKHNKKETLSYKTVIKILN